MEGFASSLAPLVSCKMVMHNPGNYAGASLPFLVSQAQVMTSLALELDAQRLVALDHLM